MHTVMVVGSGIAVLLVAVLLARRIGGPGSSGALRVVKGFIPVWLVIALINMWVGVNRAGYTVAQELPFFAVVFGMPAAVAAVLWWRLARR